VDNQEKNTHAELRFIIIAAVFLALGLSIGYLLGKNSQQQQTATNMGQIPTPSIIPSSQLSVNPDCPPISSSPIINGNSSEKTLEFASEVEKYRVNVLIPPEWNIAIARINEVKPCGVIDYDIRSNDNKSVLKIAYSGEAVGWPLPTNAVSIKKIDRVEEIVRYYGNEENTAGYFYHNNMLNPEAGYKDYRMSSGFVLKNGKRFAALGVSLLYSGPENEKNATLKIADKIVSSLSLK
jgi:hypothetical protein